MGDEKSRFRLDSGHMDISRVSIFSSNIPGDSHVARSLGIHGIRCQILHVCNGFTSNICGPFELHKFLHSDFSKFIYSRPSLRMIRLNNNNNNVLFSGYVRHIFKIVHVCSKTCKKYTGRNKAI